MDLPVGWKRLPLNEICESKPLVNPRKTPSKEFDYVDIASVSNETFSIGETKRLLGSEAPSRARKPIFNQDVIFATTRPYLKSIAMVPKNLDGQVCSTGFCVLRPSPRVLAEWLFYNAISDDFVRQIIPKMRGANYPAVSDADVLESLIPLPPIEEQRRLVSRIDEMMEKVQEIRMLRTSALDESIACFPSLLNSRFAALQQGCNCTGLGKVCDILGGSSLPKGSPEEVDPWFPLLLKVGDLNLPGNETFVTTGREFATSNPSGRVWPRGTIVLPKRGGAIATNKKRILGRSALLDPNLMGLVPHDEQVLSSYLFLWFENFDLMTLVSGGIVPQLNKKDLEPLRIPVPRLSDQEQVVEELMTSRMIAEQVVAIQSECKRADDQIGQSILRKAFAGEL
jgi:type I restriction enzyme S subunit